MATTRRSRLAAGAFAAGLILVPLAGCSADAEDTSASELTAAAESARSAAESAGSAASSAASEASDRVDCSGDSCSVTVSTGSDVELLGTRLSLDSVADGQATLSVGDRTVTCGADEDVTVGPLSLACSDIGDDSVTLTASLG
jgi:hypothetical protein